jgi:predicted Zn-dependent protease
LEEEIVAGTIAPVRSIIALALAAALFSPRAWAADTPAVPTSSTPAASSQPGATAAGASAAAAASSNPVLRAMKAELDRSVAKLKNAGEAPLYYLAYRIYDTESVDIRANYGGLLTDSQSDKHRIINVDLRVGTAQEDNTHKVRGSWTEFYGSRGSSARIPIEDDETALRVALWAQTDRDFKAAQKKLTAVKANRDVKVIEEDASADFSVEPPHQYSAVADKLSIDRPVWENRVRQLAKLYRSYKDITDATMSFSATRTVRYLVTSEGAQIEDARIQYRVFTTAECTADDGMKLWLYDGVEAPAMADVPDEARLTKMVHDLAQSLEALRVAKVAEPYVGPAILKAKAAGVFFHETFGHRIEGHRQKNEDEGRTFAKKVEQKIMPDFITVSDDPTRERLGKKPLNGYYKYDDEGVPARPVTLVDKGVLKTFLMSRSPIKNFSVSNGHGRCAPGNDPVARQANLIVDSTKRVPYAKLREMLIAEVKRQGKPYGLIFDEIAGGFTMTETFMPQVYKLLPLRVWKVYPDGRPDELLRGVDLIGTPLASLERIVCGGDDDDVFNGTCGAESGWVPVSSSAPSLLVDTIEVERQYKSQDKPPILPPPLAGRASAPQRKTGEGEGGVDK